MSNLSRFNPFRALTRFDPSQRDIEEFFKVPWLSLQNWERYAGQIPINVTEDERSFKIRAEIPGYAKDEISVSVDRDQVAISAEAHQEKEHKQGEQVIMRECYCGKQYRSFCLPQEVDSKDASASYSDGVLELVLPKAGGGTRVKNIAIQ